MTYLKLGALVFRRPFNEISAYQLQKTGVRIGFIPSEQNIPLPAKFMVRFLLTIVL
jgi:hypothetical protein